MTTQPLCLDVFNVPRHLLSNLDSLISLDRGCSLTKIVYVPKTAMEDKESETLPLTCALFLNKEFEKGLEWAKEKAHLPAGGVMRVTGAGGIKYEELITKVLGLKTQFVDEFASQCEGLKFLVNNLPIEEISYPKIDSNDTDVIQKSQMMEKMMEKFKEAMTGDTKDLSEEKLEQIKTEKWPALFVFIGSGGGIVMVNQEQKFKLVGGIPFAGKSFMGLSKLLLGTSDYNEITEMANSGDRRNVDTQVLDVIVDDPNSPYGRFPPDLPIFPFGKASDLEKNLNDFSREDIAASLAALCAHSIISAVMMGAATTKTPRVFMGGNLFRGEIFRKEIDRVFKLWGGFAFFQLHYIKTGHTGALGALLTKPGTEMAFLDA